MSYYTESESIKQAIESIQSRREAIRSQTQFMKPGSTKRRLAKEDQALGQQVNKLKSSLEEKA